MSFTLYTKVPFENVLHHLLSGNNVGESAMLVLLTSKLKVWFYMGVKHGL
jgi:hypothetical protein